MTHRVGGSYKPHCAYSLVVELGISIPSTWVRFPLSAYVLVFSLKKYHIGAIV